MLLLPSLRAPWYRNGACSGQSNPSAATAAAGPSFKDETMQTPEEMIAEMSTDELQELLGELGIDANEQQAAGIKQLVDQLGSLEAAIEALFQLDDQTGRRAA